MVTRVSTQQVEFAQIQLILMTALSLTSIHYLNRTCEKLIKVPRDENLKKLILGMLFLNYTRNSPTETPTQKF